MPPPSKSQQSRNPLSSLAQALIAEINYDLGVLEGIQNNLSDEYPQIALGKFVDQFRTIIKKYNRITSKLGQYGKIMRSSKSISSVASKLISQIKSTGRLFNKYKKKPSSYDSFEAYFQIDCILVELGNLKKCCQELT